MSNAIISGESGFVEFDAVENEDLNKSNQITENPIEDGSNIVDHIKSNQDSLTFTAHLTGDDIESRYDILRLLCDNGDLCTFSYKNYVSDVVIETMKISSSNKNKNGYTFNITLKNIRKVSYQTVDTWLPLYDTQMSELQNGGNEQTNETDTDDEVEESWLVRIGNRITGWF